MGENSVNNQNAISIGVYALDPHLGPIVLNLMFMPINQNFFSFYFFPSVKMGADAFLTFF